MKDGHSHLEPEIHISDVGAVIDVATPTRAKLLFTCIWQSIVLGPLLGMPAFFAWYLIFKVPSRDEYWYIYCILGIILSAIGWWLGTSPVRHFKAMSERIYLRAGPDGITFRYPGDATFYSLGLKYEIVIESLYWSEIRTWYPYDYKIGKHVYNQTIILEGTDDWKIEIPMIYFKEPRDEIVDDISQSCEMSHIRAEKDY